MLKIRIVAIGEPKDRWVEESCEHYIKLIGRWANIEIKSISSPKGIATLPPSQIMDREAERLQKEFGKGKTIALSDRGKRLDSHAFAEAIRSLEMTSSGVATFVIGGPYGLAQLLLDRADGVYSLSPLAFSHQLARTVLLEQIYRAYTIIHNTAYHK